MHRPLLRSTVLASAIVAFGCSNEGSEYDSDPLIVCTDDRGCPEGTRCVQGQFCESVQPVEPGSGGAGPTVVVVTPGGGSGGGGSRDGGVQGDAGFGADGGFGSFGDGGQLGTCGVGQLACQGVCADAQSDSNNCGACGIACTGADTCRQGVCCGPVGTVCGTTCADLTSDRNNCGVCGLVCATGAECVLGACRENLPGTPPDPGFND